MLIFADTRMPLEAKEKLQKYGKVVDFETKDICYNAISCHPDVFMFQHPNGLVVAPNIPIQYKDLLNHHAIAFELGEKDVGISYPHTARYNALYTSFGVLHNAQISDSSIRQKFQYNFMHCKQAYVRCTSIELARHILSSDLGMVKLMSQKSVPFFYVEPQSIQLQGFPHGFFGGCCGLFSDTLFVCGSLSFHPQGSQLYRFLDDNDISLIELYEGPLMDVGGIFFLES